MLSAATLGRQQPKGAANSSGVYQEAEDPPERVQSKSRLNAAILSRSDDHTRAHARYMSTSRTYWRTGGAADPCCRPRTSFGNNFVRSESSADDARCNLRSSSSPLIVFKMLDEARMEAHVDEGLGGTTQCLPL